MRAKQISPVRPHLTTCPATLQPWPNATAGAIRSCQSGFSCSASQWSRAGFTRSAHH